jgi:hypothetical protein
VNYIYIVLVLLIFGISFCFWYFSYRYWHLGNGMVLARNKDDGTVWVTSRLIDSPSGRAGVQNQSRVLSHNGQNALFASDEEFLSWTKGNKGKKAIWEFEDGIVVELVPEMIKTKIPVYWLPGKTFEAKEKSAKRNPNFTQGMFICGKTEQFIATRKISNEVIRRLIT